MSGRLCQRISFIKTFSIKDLVNSNEYKQIRWTILVQTILKLYLITIFFQLWFLKISYILYKIFSYQFKLYYQLIGSHSGNWFLGP